MARADFRCPECGHMEEIDLSIAVQSMTCDNELGDGARCPVMLERVWAPPHLGPMSSGEPPR